MRFFLILIFFLTATSDIFSQIRFDAPISKNDSISIDLFWNTFRSSIQQKDKQKLASLFKFPFYCPQCLDYDRAENSFKATMKVSKRIFIRELLRRPLLTLSFSDSRWNHVLQAGPFSRDVRTSQPLCRFLHRMRYAAMFQGSAHFPRPQCR